MTEPVRFEGSPAFPKLSHAEANRRILELSHLPLREVRELATVSLDGVRFYETAVVRASPEDLVRFQSSIRELADTYGFPSPRARGAFTEFDRELSKRVFELLRMLPAEAADEEVWSYLTLNVCPEIAFWRFPKGADDDDRQKYERWLGKPRNIFRRAWWRAYLLGDELASQLIEDEIVGITERPSIGGHRDLAREVARTHLRHVGFGLGGSRQNLLRMAMKRLRRRMGLISVYSLEHDRMTTLVDEVFAESLEILRRPSVAVDEGNEIDHVRAFEVRVPKYWHLLREYAVEVQWGTISEQRMALAEYRVANSANEVLANKLISDLELLIGQWDSMSPSERAVVHAATRYFLLEEDDIPDGSPLGLNDDDEVISAAYEALSRVRV